MLQWHLVLKGRMRVAGDELMHVFSADDFYLQNVEVLGMYLTPCIELQEYIHSNSSQKTKGEHAR